MTHPTPTEILAAAEKYVSIIQARDICRCKIDGEVAFSRSEMIELAITCLDAFLTEKPHISSLPTPQAGDEEAATAFIKANQRLCEAHRTDFRSTFLAGIFHERAKAAGELEDYAGMLKIAAGALEILEQDKLAQKINDLLAKHAREGGVMGKSFKIVGEDMSDGFHTFDELYEHRCLLFINLCLANQAQAYWRPHYDGWPLIGLDSKFGQMTYHVPEKYLPLFRSRIKEGGPEWDGHSSAQVIERLKLFAEDR